MRSYQYLSREGHRQNHHNLLVAGLVAAALAAAVLLAAVNCD
jgi:membrane-bound metal-dependent hydrolase YbcI (DUF457 family)